jgi:hypothetical protein
VIDLNIHMRQIECDRDASIMGEVVIRYEELLNSNPIRYGNQLEGETFSHIQLMRAVTAVIAF